jgi:hypothetical protein
VDVGSLIGTMLGSGSSSKKSTKKSGVDLSDGLDIGDVVGIVGKLIK